MTAFFLKDFFAEDEIEGAKRYVEEFHGKLLVSDSLSRADAVLLGAYMVSNANKASEINKDEAKGFASKLGVSSDDYSKGLYEAKKAKLLNETDSKMGLTFRGIKKIRQMLSVEEAQAQPTMKSREVQLGEVPSIGTPGSAREAIIKLFSSTWGKKPRTLGEILDALELNATYYPKGTTSKELTRMTQRGTLRRLRREGQLAYVLARKPESQV